MPLVCKPLVIREKKVGWEGLEPSTNALKGHCSTIELPTPNVKNETEQWPRNILVARNFDGHLFEIDSQGTKARLAAVGASRMAVSYKCFD